MVYEWHSVIQIEWFVIYMCRKVYVFYDGFVDNSPKWVKHMGQLLLAWFNINPIMDK